MKNIEDQAKMLDNTEFFEPKKPVVLKGLKKIIRKEQSKLQEKHKNRKESNTKVKKPVKKAKLAKS